VSAPDVQRAIARDEWQWFGSAGHLIVGQDCRFHLCTLVGGWLVSTVGEWLPDSASWHIYAETRGVTLEGRGDERRADFLNKVGYMEIGYGRKYETMVFRASVERCTAEDCDCGAPLVQKWNELDAAGYNLRGDAQRGHQAMCEKWSTIAAEDLAACRVCGCTDDEACDDGCYWVEADLCSRCAA
jgi:hypothetical protein